MTTSAPITVTQASKILRESRSATMLRIVKGDLPHEKIKGDKRDTYVLRLEDVERLRDEKIEQLHADAGELEAAKAGAAT